MEHRIRGLWSGSYRMRAISCSTKLRGLALLTAVIACTAFSATPTPVQAAQSADTKAQENFGAESYAKHCAICHGDHREGILPGFPPLAGIQHRLKDSQIVDLIHAGKGRMPGFPKVRDRELTELLLYLDTAPVPATVATTSAAGNPAIKKLTGAAAAGGALFLQNCAFCHGRDAMGGETGPDLTQSKLVTTDTDGSNISEVIRLGRVEKKMPAFNFSNQELSSLVAFIRARQAAAEKGNRRGVDVTDLQTGNADAGKRFFHDNCSKCHSVTGDLALIGSRVFGLRLEERMLYPQAAPSKVTVTPAGGKKITGTLAYLDEFTVGLYDKDWAYHSWPTDQVKFSVDSPANAHIELFPKYTDDDVHNLMAYLQSLK